MAEGPNDRDAGAEAQRRETDDPLLNNLAAGISGMDITDQDHLEAPDPSPTASSINVDDLLNPTSHTITLLEEGRVFARQSGRLARLSIGGSQLFAHSLRNDLRILQMRDIVPRNPPCRVFLDLQWPNNGRRGRVILHLFSDCSLSQQFLLLCTGQRGPSYVDTPLLGVMNKGIEGERVFGGILINDREREEAQLPRLDAKKTRRPDRQGDVIARIIEGSLNAQFAILTTNRSTPAKSGAVFGEVESGLEVLQSAAEYNNVTLIKVVDCGLVIPLRTRV